MSLSSPSLRVRVSPLAAAFLLAAAVLPQVAPAAALGVYLSAPGEEYTYIAGAQTETFNSLTPGLRTTSYTSAIGTYDFSRSNPVAVMSADQYGGASNSNYIAFGAQSHSSAPVTLALSNPATYFGFWWSAGDRNNGLSFYYNNTFLTRFTTGDIINLLNSNNGIVTAIDGHQYSRSSYYGNPNPGANHGRDNNEPFAYVNIFASNTGFNRIVFDNNGSSGTGFESDNHASFLGAAAPNGASVFIENVPAVGVAITPEPSTFALSGLALLGCAFAFRNRRKA